MARARLQRRADGRVPLTLTLTLILTLTLTLTPTLALTLTLTLRLSPNPNPNPGELMAEYLPEGTEGQTVVVEACRFKHLGAASTVMPGFDPSGGLQLGSMAPQRT